MTKCQKFYLQMVEENKELFDSFAKLHLDYVLDPPSWQDKFNREGEKVLKVIRLWESRLCSTSERGGYGSFSPKLAEKFREEIRQHYPKIDFIGVKS